MHMIQRVNSRTEAQMKRKLWKPTLVAALSLGASLGLAFGPEDALRYQDPRVPLVRSQLEAFERDLQAPPLSLVLRPGYTLKYAGGTTGLMSPTDDTALGANLELNYSFDDESRARALRDYERFRSSYYETTVGATEDALIAHARLWRFTAQLRPLQLRVDLAQRRLNETKQKQGVTQAEIDRAQGALDQAQNDLQQAQLELQRARDEAARFNFQGNPEGRTLRFVIPEARLEDLSAYRRAQAELALARAAARKAGFEVFRSVSLSANYSTSSTNTSLGVGVSVSLDRGTPSVGARTGVSYNFVPNNDPGKELSLNLGASIYLDQLFGSGGTRTQIDGQLAQIDFERTQVSLATRLRSLREEVALAERALDQAEAGIAAEQRSFQALEAQFKAGQISEFDYLDRLGDARAERDAARAWENYIRTVGDYLTFVGGQWRVR